MEKQHTNSWISFIFFFALVLLFIPVNIYDHEIFTVLNGFHTPLKDTFWLTFTTIGDGFLLGIILGAFLVVNPRLTVFGLTLLILSSLAGQVIKAVIPMPRPVAVLDSVHVIGPLLRSGSFPSGHAGAGMAAGLAIAYFSPSLMARILAITMGVLIGISRIFVGAHFPQDVVGGMLCSVAIFLIFSSWVWPWLESRIPDRPSISRPLFRIACGAEGVAAVAALFIHAPRYAESPSVAMTVAALVLGFVAVGLWRLWEAEKGSR